MLGVRTREGVQVMGSQVGRMDWTGTRQVPSFFLEAPHFQGLTTYLTLPPSRHKAQDKHRSKLLLLSCSKAMALSYLVKVKQIRSHASPPPQPGLCPLARPVSLLNGRRPGAWRAVAQRRWAILAAVACPGRASMSGRLVGRTGQFSGLRYITL